MFYSSKQSMLEELTATQKLCYDTLIYNLSLQSRRFSSFTFARGLSTESYITEQMEVNTLVISL